MFAIRSNDSMAPDQSPDKRCNPVTFCAAPGGEAGEECSGCLGCALAGVQRFVNRYVAFASPDQAVAVTLWVAHTHVFEYFDTSPILAITSAEKRSGKTRLLDVLELLVARPWRTVLPSEAVVYRKIEAEHPTLMLDEADAIFGKATGANHEGLRALLNAGNRAGTKVPRMIGASTEMTVKDFDVYTPKVVAGIGSLPDTVADRSILIRLRRRASSETVDRFRRGEVQDVADDVLNTLAAHICTYDFDGARPELPVELDDRAADGWEPLLAIAEVAGGDWVSRGRKAAIALSADRELEDESLSHIMLADIRIVFETRNAPYVHTADLVADLKNMSERPWGTFYGRGLGPHDIARLIRPYGVSSSTVRKGGTVLKGYRRADFEDSWARYLPQASLS